MTSLKAYTLIVVSRVSLLAVCKIKYLFEKFSFLLVSDSPLSPSVWYFSYSRVLRSSISICQKKKHDSAPFRVNYLLIELLCDSYASSCLLLNGEFIHPKNSSYFLRNGMPLALSQLCFDFVRTIVVERRCCSFDAWSIINYKNLALLVEKWRKKVLAHGVGSLSAARCLFSHFAIYQAAQLVACVVAKKYEKSRCYFCCVCFRFRAHGALLSAYRSPNLNYQPVRTSKIAMPLRHLKWARCSFWCLMRLAAAARLFRPSTALSSDLRKAIVC